MLVNVSLFFIVVAGIGFLALPEHVLGIPKDSLNGVARYWVSSLKLFSVPLCLLILGFTKNVLIQLANSIWALWLLATGLFFFASFKNEAPNLTLYGKAFISVVLIFSLCQLLFSAIRFLPKSLQIGGEKDPPVNPS